MRCYRLILTIFLLSAVARAAPSDIQGLINSLGDPDPVARESAAEEIKHRGAAARSALLAALQSDNPEIAARAGAILQELPWHLPGDPPHVREILTAYGKGDDNARFEAIARLRALASVPAHDAMCRLLREEPSDGTRWVVESMLRTAKGERFRSRVRDLDTTTAAENAPLLAAVGWAWHGRDMKKSTDLLRRAVELQLARPTEEYGEVRSAILPMLIDEATHARHLDDAADLLRKQAGAAWPSAANGRRGPILNPAGMDDAPPGPVLHLMMLHAEFGPLPGFSGDLRNFGPSLDDPRLLYCVGRLLDRAGFSISARACEAIAAASGSSVPQSRLMAGYFLMQRNWHEVARCELLAAQRLPGGDKRIARLLLAKNAADQDDFAEAAAHLQAIPPTVPPNAEEARSIASELHWRLFQAARAKGDETATKKELDAIVGLMPISGEIAMDAVPALKKIGRVADADRLFAAAYSANAAPPVPGAAAAELEDPERMNNIAWLCSRSGERLDEALKLSTQAITAEPENAAYLDTAAEANFRLGKSEEAVRLETRALKFRPADKFMLGQLERFKKPTNAL